MKKVITKCKLRSRQEFVQKLYDIEMKFGPIYWQHDRVYVPRNYKPKANYPRLVMRTEMTAVDKTSIYKMILRRHIEDSGVDIINETIVKDYTEVVNMIHQLGFVEKGEVSRRRQELKMGDGIMVYLDKVEGLPGYYAKIESELADG